jgi:hypothetical protein
LGGVLSSQRLCDDLLRFGAGVTLQAVLGSLDEAGFEGVVVNHLTNLGGDCPPLGCCDSFDAQDGFLMASKDQHLVFILLFRHWINPDTA